MDIEAELLKSMEKDELEHLIKEKIASFHGLLTKEVALRLIAREKGLLREKEEQLGDLPKGARDVAFRARVRRIWPIAAYASGKKSQVIAVKDETGEKPLVLWNKDVELIKGLRAGDIISVKGAYEKAGELHFGYKGSITVEERAPLSTLDKLKDNEPANVKGFISKIEGYDKFVREDKSSVAFSFIISDGKTERRVVIWEDNERGEKLSEEDEILIEGGLVNKGDIDLDSASRIKIRRKER